MVAALDLGSSAERRGGSSPFIRTRNRNAKIAQLVEHNLAKVGVAGSNPVSRSLIFTSKREVNVGIKID